MTEPSLYQLLWGATDQNDQIAQWSLHPFEVPAVGLPTVVATSLFIAAQKHLPKHWNPSKGPLTWKLAGCKDVLAAGRLMQFGLKLKGSPNFKDSNIIVERSMDWDLAPHSAFFRPMLNARKVCEVERSTYALYCDVLLLLTAMDGGESVLDRIFETGKGIVPFEDRWDWRSRIHLPVGVWKSIELMIKWSSSPDEDFVQEEKNIAKGLRKWTKSRLTIDDFKTERVDISLDIRGDLEFVRTVQSRLTYDKKMPKKLRLNPKIQTKDLTVRIGQISAWIDRTKVIKLFPRMKSNFVNAIMQQVESVFWSRSHGEESLEPDLIIFPEISIPVTEVGTIRDLVRQTGRACLAGLYWRQLAPVYGRQKGPLSKCWFVNEAELVLPISTGRGPTSVRWYRVRKPVPAHIEEGLAKALTEKRKDGTWKVLKGRRWYRFLHPVWGDFSIAICADLLDPSPWKSLSGELLHLFMVAFNKDVDLYESLTWIRAYENYVNLVAVNHGIPGGSFVWTPRRSRGRELAKLRGGELMLIADIRLPVQELTEQQVNGTEKTVERLAREWRHPKDQRAEFKSVPPEFERRALLDDDAEISD